MNTSIVPKGDTWGLILVGAGILTIIIALSVQFSVIDNGSSNQLTIDSETSKTIWGVATGAILFLVGYVLWLWFSTLQNKYLATFILAFSSYFISNFALLFSQYQVQVTKV